MKIGTIKYESITDEVKIVNILYDSGERKSSIIHECKNIPRISSLIPFDKENYFCENCKEKIPNKIIFIAHMKIFNHVRKS